MRAWKNYPILIAVAVAAVLGGANSALSADLGRPHHSQVASRSPWSFSFTPYVWLPWLTGDLAVRGRTLDVDVSPDQVLEALDWSRIPFWMSNAEARNNRFSLIGDIVYTRLTGAGGFSRTSSGGRATLSGNTKGDLTQVIAEFGGTYEVWRTGTPSSSSHATALDVLAGGRYWRFDIAASANADLALNLPILGPVGSGGRVVARSGTVDWVDPFVGLRLRSDLARGQELSLRGDIGGFGAGSDLSWHLLATYDFTLRATDRYTLNGYLGYKALYVDYSKGSGSSQFEYDVLQHGPVMGATIRF